MTDHPNRANKRMERVAALEASHAELLAALKTIKSVRMWDNLSREQFEIICAAIASAEAIARKDAL